MRYMTDDQVAVWKSGKFTGPNRPMMRATIQTLSIQVEAGQKWSYSDYHFGQANVPRELPNIKSIHYDRHIDTDAATMTMQLYNTTPLPLGTAVEPDAAGNYSFDLPGFFTFNRGSNATESSRWNHVKNQWQGLLAPDRVVRTYEGYGFDPLAIPEEDANQVQSGIWLIDQVEYTAEGLITLTCRDAARLLIDSIIFPPIIPMSRYPLRYIANHDVANPPITVSTSGWSNLTYDTDSGVPYYGVDGNIHGHYPHYAFDSDTRTYWLSVGNAHPRADYAFEYVQGRIAASTIRYVQFRVWGGPYVAYVSVFAGGRWQGAATVPYNPDDIVSAPNGANIRFVKRLTVDNEELVTVDLGKAYTGVTKVRVCLTNLYNSHIGPYVYRGGIRSFKVSATVSHTETGGTHVEGDFGDYSTIVKQLLAWAGFHWPRKTAQAFVTWSDGSRHTLVAPSDDWEITGNTQAKARSGDGRVWGDIESAGTGAIPGTILDVDVFDKKPVMDGINYVREVLGYIFYIDETGAAVFRSPNIWKLGNFVGDLASGKIYVEGMDNIYTIDENQTLISLNVVLSSHNIRDRVFVANVSGKIGATQAGRYGPSGPFNSNLRRVAGWTDQNFSKQSECNRMADLITLRQLFTYRTNQVRIPGFSGIQIDDQVRIFEGTTSESFVHYVVGLSSDWDIETGEWWYDLETHWLGTDPTALWTFNRASLTADTVYFLQAIGRI